MKKKSAGFYSTAGNEKETREEGGKVEGIDTIQ
jgi:hypothetical protein